MKDWGKVLSDPERVGWVNTQLGSALAHCPPLEAQGWSFRCSECHVGPGTFSVGRGRDWHSHGEYQIEIALAGRFEFETIDGDKILLRHGRALVIPWKRVHRWTCLGRGAMMGISLELLPSAASVRKDGLLIARSELVTDPSVKLLSDGLLDAASTATIHDFSGKILSCRLFLLLALLMERFFPSPPMEDAPADGIREVRGREIIVRVVNSISENPGADLRLSDVARAAGVSGRHLHRLFLKHVGTSFHDYLLGRRLEKAYRMLLLQGNKAMVKEIAFACGFNSAAAFSNAFRKFFGVQPSGLLANRFSIKQRFTDIPLAGLGNSASPITESRGEQKVE